VHENQGNDKSEQHVQMHTHTLKDFHCLAL